jgi:hypothetical protein
MVPLSHAAQQRREAPMAGTGTSATAKLVGARDAGGRPAAATVTVAREEIEEALASDEAPELILEVKQGDGEPRDVHVAWERRDLEAVIADTKAGEISFSFDPSELYRALEHPDFEGHGFREAVLLTVAAASASAAVAVSTAQAGPVEGTGAGGAAAAAMVSPGHDEAVTASTLANPAAANDEAGLAARGIGVTLPGADETSLAARGIEQPAASAGHDEAMTASTLANPAAANDEAGLAARGIGVTLPGADETTLAARGIEQQPTPAAHDEATLVDRGIADAPVTVDSGTGLELPSIGTDTAAAIGGLAGAGLLIVGGTFVARRRIGTT